MICIQLSLSACFQSLLRLVLSPLSSSTSSASPRWLWDPTSMQAFVQAVPLPGTPVLCTADSFFLNSAQGLLLGEISLILPGCWSLLHLGPRPCGPLFTSDLTRCLGTYQPLAPDPRLISVSLRSAQGLAQSRHFVHVWREGRKEHMRKRGPDGPFTFCSNGTTVSGVPDVV